MGGPLTFLGIDVVHVEGNRPAESQNQPRTVPATIQAVAEVELYFSLTSILGSRPLTQIDG